MGNSSYNSSSNGHLSPNSLLNLSRQNQVLNQSQSPVPQLNNGTFFANNVAQLVNNANNGLATSNNRM